MSVMLRQSFRSAATAAICFVALSLHAQAADLNQYLRDHYQGKIFVLRSFYPGDHLRYNSSGAQVGDLSAGDWTGDGFVLVKDIHVSGDRLIIDARRVIVTMGKKFQLHPMADPKHDNGKRTVLLKIEADGMRNVALDQADAAISKIFLTSQDSLSEMVPDYWKPCVIDGLKGTNDSCQFSDEMLAIPGVSTTGNASEVSTAADSNVLNLAAKGYRLSKGVRPPKVLYNHDPEFNERARLEKYQGTLTLGVIVTADGLPSKIRVLSPLGCGLDAKAVQAVSGWKFQPAEKDGQPVPVQIAVEVDFHLY